MLSKLATYRASCIYPQESGEMLFLKVNIFIHKGINLVKKVYNYIVVNMFITRRKLGSYEKKDPSTYLKHK